MIECEWKEKKITDRIKNVLAAIMYVGKALLQRI